MELTEIFGLKVGERKAIRATGRYKVGQVLHDDDPYVSAVVRVVQVGQSIYWDRDRLDDEDEFGASPRAGETTTDIVVERIERSPAGAAKVAAYNDRWTPVRQDSDGTIRVTRTDPGDDGFFGETGAIRRLSRDSRLSGGPRHVYETPAQVNATHAVYRGLADGWYYASAMRSPSTSSGYLFDVVGSRLSQIIPADQLHLRYGMDWRNNFEAQQRFLAEL